MVMISSEKFKSISMANSAIANSAAFAAAALAGRDKTATSNSSTVLPSAVTSSMKTENNEKPSNSRMFNKIVLTLENSLIPEDKLESTPSFLDGLDSETEKDLRILGCELIQTAGILLKLPQVAMATGQVLFQRFFYSKSFVRHNMETVAMSCLCLASKIEEAPRRIRDVMNVFHHIKQVRTQREITPMIVDQYYTNQKTQVIKAERRVLKELGFCVHVKHPHKLIVMYLQVLKYETHEKLMQMSWNFMNDSLRTDVFMRHQPETIACACIYLSARKLNIPLPKNPPWFGVFRVTEDDIISICYRVMELYTREKVNVEKLETAVEGLKKRYMESRTKLKEANTITATTTVDRNNGSHNAWGGFIQRAVPLPLNLPLNAEKVSENRSRSRSRSRRSRSRSRRSSNSHSDSPRPRSARSRSNSLQIRTRSNSRSMSVSSIEYRKSTKKSTHLEKKKKSIAYSRSLSNSPREKHRKRKSRDYDRDSDHYVLNNSRDSRISTNFVDNKYRNERGDRGDRDRERNDRERDSMRSSHRSSSSRQHYQQSHNHNSQQQRGYGSIVHYSSSSRSSKHHDQDRSRDRKR